MSIATKPPVPSHVGVGSQKLADFNGSDPGPSPASVLGSNKSHTISSSKRVMRHRGDTSILNAGLSIVFILYSIFIIIIGIWGNSMLSKTCIDPDVRSNLRGLLISGSVSATAFISYSACKIICTSETVSDVVGENWFLALGFIVGMANFIMGIQLRNQISSKPECQDGSFTSFDQVLLFFNIFSAMVWIVILVIFGYRLAGHYKKLVVQEKQKRVSEEVELQNIAYNQQLQQIQESTAEAQRKAQTQLEIAEKERQLETASQSLKMATDRLSNLQNAPKAKNQSDISESEKTIKMLQEQFENTKKDVEEKARLLDIQTKIEQERQKAEALRVQQESLHKPKEPQVDPHSDLKKELEKTQAENKINAERLALQKEQKRNLDEAERIKREGDALNRSRKGVQPLNLVGNQIGPYQQRFGPTNVSHFIDSQNLFDNDVISFH